MRRIGNVVVIGLLVSIGACGDSVTAVDPVTGEFGDFEHVDQIPTGWIPCGDLSCAEVLDNLPCGDLGVPACEDTPRCQVVCEGQSAAGVADSACLAACVPADPSHCSEQDESSCAASDRCEWVSGECFDSLVADKEPACRPGICKDAPEEDESSPCGEHTGPDACNADETCSWFQATCRAQCPIDDAWCICRSQCFPKKCEVPPPSVPSPLCEARLVPVIGNDGCPSYHCTRGSSDCDQIALDYREALNEARVCALNDPRMDGDALIANTCSETLPSDLYCACPVPVNALNVDAIDQAKTLVERWDAERCGENQPICAAGCASVVNPGCVSVGGGEKFSTEGICSAQGYAW